MDSSASKVFVLKIKQVITPQQYYFLLRNNFYGYATHFHVYIPLWEHYILYGLAKVELNYSLI